MKKNIKIVSLIIVIALISSLLVGCSDGPHHFNYDEMIKKVVKIDIVETSGSKGFNKYDRHLATVDEELIDDFLLDLSKIEFFNNCMICNIYFPEGITFYIYYNDVDFDVVGTSSSMNLEINYNCALEDYEYLVNKYYVQTEN